MKRTFSFIAAALLVLAACGGVACSKSDTGRPTAAPSSGPTVSPTRDSMLRPSASPSVSASPAASASPDVSASPDMSAGPMVSPGMSPGGSMSPNTTPGVDATIDGFMEGKVIDPSEIPEITAVINREFPEHTIQSVTHEYYEGQQVYRIVLQGEGELSRVLFVYPNGSILLPAAAD